MRNAKAHELVHQSGAGRRNDAEVQQHAVDRHFERAIRVGVRHDISGLTRSVANLHARAGDRIAAARYGSRKFVRRRLCEHGRRGQSHCRQPPSHADLGTIVFVP